MTDYKKYALGQVENFLYDAMSTDATPQEIYDVIKGVVQDNLEVYTKSADQARELLSLLNGHRSVDFVEEHSEYYYDFDRNKPLTNTCDKDDTSEKCKKSWTSFWEEPSMPPWGHSDLEYGIHYSEKELDAMCDAAENKIKMSVQNSGENGDGYFISTDKVKRWILPVEEDGDDCVITFPDDLLEAANLKEGDQIEWVPQDDGSCILKKIEAKN
jgi:hypothetical protein